VSNGIFELPAVKIFKPLTSKILLFRVVRKNGLSVIIKECTRQNRINTKLLENFEGCIQITEKKLLGLFAVYSVFYS